MLYNKIIHLLLAISQLHYPNIEQIRCIQQTIYFEASPRSMEQAKMIARVVMNRVNSNQFPDTPCAVISQANQFEYFMGFNMRPPDDNMSLKIWNQDFDIAYITYVFDRWLPQKYNYVLYFHTTNVTQYSEWEYKKIVIGNQVFFKR